MFHDPNACHFCGRYVLEVEGWAESTQPYHLIPSPWDPESPLLNGASFHLSCVRDFDWRDKFRQAFLDWITTTESTITVRDTDGVDREMSRTGLGFTERIAHLASGEIYENPRFNRWAFIEHAGPYHIFDMKQVEALSRGERIRGNDGGRSRPLRKDPGTDISGWDLLRLLDFLEIRDLYQGMLDNLEPEYEFWDSGHSRAGFVLEYSLSCIQPIPTDVTEFFRQYIPEYIPKRLEDA